MAPWHRRPAGPAGPIVASAELLTGKYAVISRPGENSRLPTADTEVWDYWATEPAVHFGAEWMSASVGRCALVVADVARDGTLLGPTTNERAAALLPAALGNQDAQRALLRDLALVMFVSGDGVVVLEIAAGSYTGKADAYSSHLCNTATGGAYRLSTGDGLGRVLDPATCQAIRVWRPSPVRPHLADSPVRAVLSTLREMRALRTWLLTTIDSRFVSNGILKIPAELDLPAGEDGVTPRQRFVRDLAEMMVLGIDDPTGAAARVPQFVFGAAEYLKGLEILRADHELTDVVVALRESALKMLALGFSMPASILLGQDQSNHWSSFRISADAIDSAVLPALHLITSSLQREWFADYLETNGLDPAAFCLTGDVSPLREPVDRSKNTFDALDRNLISAATARADLGYSETDAPSGPPAVPAPRPAPADTRPGVNVDVPPVQA